MNNMNSNENCNRDGFQINPSLLNQEDSPVNPEAKASGNTTSVSVNGNSTFEQPIELLSDAKIAVSIPAVIPSENSDSVSSTSVELPFTSDKTLGSINPMDVLGSVNKMTTLNNGHARMAVILSFFSGMDLFIFGLVKAGFLPGYQVERNFYAALMAAENYKDPDGNPVIEFIDISDAEFSDRKTFVDEHGRKSLADTAGKLNDRPVRTKEIQEINGYDLRRMVEEKYGKDVIIGVIGGPPCTNFTKINSKRNVVDVERNFLVFEFLRMVKEIAPDFAFMEEVPELGEKQNAAIYNEFLNRAKQLNYNFADQNMNALHYGGHQSRERKIMVFVDKKYPSGPVFPTPILNSGHRIKDFLDIDYAIFRQFSGRILTGNDFMSTITSGDPSIFVKRGVRVAPTYDELLDCFGVPRGEYKIPIGIPAVQIRKGIGNAVCVEIGAALIQSVLQNVLRLRSIGNGYFVPIDSDPSGGSPSGGSPFGGSPSGGSPSGGSPSGGSPSGGLPTGVRPSVDSPSSVVPSGVEKPFGPDSKIDSPVKGESISQIASPFAGPFPTGPSRIGDLSGRTEPLTSSARVSTYYSPQIVSSIALEAMTFSSLNYSGRWFDFFGSPSLIHHTVITGLSGHGKSTFSIQYAKYLADNFGKVLYVSGEEGIGKTLKDKVKSNHASSHNLFFADMKDLNQLLRYVRSKDYSFIFLDSLNTMKIGINELRRVKELYPQSSIITISQSTKAGKLRGSYEIVHDCDVAIEIADGVAKTIKNRFKEKGAEFLVFAEMQLEVQTGIETESDTFYESVQDDNNN